MFIAILDDDFDNLSFYADTLEKLMEKIKEYDDKLDIEDFRIFEGNQIEIEVQVVVKKVETVQVTKKIAGNGSKIPK